MIKIKLLTGVGIAAAGTMASPLLLGCTAPAADETTETGDQANTEAIAGSGNISLHGWALHYASTSGGDEFLRVGEKMTVTFDYAHVVTHFVAQGNPSLAQSLLEDPSKLEMDVKITYTKGDGGKQELLVPIAWEAGASGLTIGKSTEFTIPKAVKGFRFDLVAKFELGGVPTARSLFDDITIGSRDFVVFGAYVPNKLAFFDSVGAQRRSRILEGGSAVRGAELTLSVSDWRLDTVVDKGSLDLVYGQKRTGNRFGPAVVPALGSVDYEVDVAYSTDDGATWGSLSLGRVDKPEVLARTDGLRFALQRAIQIPESAGSKLKLAFHVKAFLQVPNYWAGEMEGPARHAPGARILLRDTWDNNDGQDYSLPIGSN